MKKFWQFKNTAPNTAELLLYGEIQSERSWFDFSEGGIYADEFVQDLQALGDVNQITCRINSIGGDIFAAVAIYTQLKMHDAKIICIIDGLAASAATLILMAADEIQMPTGAMIMIHDPLAVLMGSYKSDELAKQADTLGTIKESIVAIYAERTGTGQSKLADLMAEETWMTVDQAIELGFADKKISAEVQTEMKGKVLYMNKIKHDLSGCKNVPEELQHAQTIAEAITSANQGGSILTQFVAMAKTKKGTKNEDPDDDPDNDPDEEPDDDPDDPETDDKKGKSKGKTKNSKTKNDDEDEEVDDEDDDEDEAEKNKKAKKSAKNLMNRYPNTINYIINQAKTEERKRIQEIDNIANQVSHALAAKAKYTDCTTAKDLLYENAMKSQAKATAYLDAFKADTQASGVKNIGGAPNAFQDISPEETRASIGEAIANIANKLTRR